MKLKYYLGLDNGGTVTKAALYTATGEEIGVASVQTQVFTPSPGIAERDMEEMWKANCTVIQNLLKKTGISAQEISGVACSGHGKGLYLWGKDKKPVRNGIVSADNRAWEYPLQWEKDGTAKKVFEISCQHIMACQPVSLLAWLRDREPECIEKIQWIFSCKDYVRFRLTGEAFAELTDYSGDNFLNLRTGQYDEKLLELFGIPFAKDALPPLRKSTDICGYITREAAEQTGLKEGTPVAGGMFDIDACDIAVAALEESQICMIAGTWSINEYVSEVPVTDGRVLMNSFSCIPNRYLIEESSATSAYNHAWFLQNLLPELKEQVEKQGKSIYDITNEWVASISPKEFCPIYTPFLMASNMDPNGRASFVGLNANHSRKHLMRSVYEGVAFSHRYHLEKLLAIRTKPLSCIRLAGGVARSPVWVQMFADVMKYPIEVVDIAEAGAFGCAITAAIACGDYESFEQACDKMVKVKQRVLPNPDNTSWYDKKYHMYCSVNQALHGIWDEMQELTEGS